ncbi:MAG: MBL fold metallo-hydrolase [Saprospiraceae bacterium]|nr:MBL fold metallo-hydrolase [Candidatus Vicinibacter affinis]
MIKSNLIIPFKFLKFLIISSLLVCLFFACHQKKDIFSPNKTNLPIKNPYLIILGTTQDAGSPQSGCKKDCCKYLYLHPDPTRKVVSLGLVDPLNEKKYLFEATPDFASQLWNLESHDMHSKTNVPDGIFISHAHIGHYTGLMYLGKESMNSKNVLVYAMPRMSQFLQRNGPWDPLIKQGNIMLQTMQNKENIELKKGLNIQPILVPHRDEYSETVGFTIYGPNKKALFIPDIDKWQKWETDIKKLIVQMDYVFIDGTFYDAAEINHRNIDEIPHPFIVETMKLFSDLSAMDKAKVHFIHFNHTNPVLNNNSKEAKQVLKNGYKIAQFNQIFEL